MNYLQFITELFSLGYCTYWLSTSVYVLVVFTRRKKDEMPLQSLKCNQTRVLLSMSLAEVVVPLW